MGATELLPEKFPQEAVVLRCGYLWAFTVIFPYQTPGEAELKIF